MPVAIVTGSGGLIGSEAVGHFVGEGFDVVGIENDMRAQFFGPESSTSHVTERLVAEHPEFRVENADIRDTEAVERIFRDAGQVELVIHTAAQPSHDWAASDPQTDFGVNANGTLNLLEAARAHCPEAPFVFCSTNKVYGDTPNRLPLEELELRLELPSSHRYHGGIDTSMSIDASTHSLFGVSKAAADLLVQEYGRYFGMPTVCFRGGCLTGPQHAGAKLHGFLAYLMKCTATGTPYTVFGYAGKQVRDNIHSADLIAAFAAFHAAPRAAADVVDGGGAGGGVESGEGGDQVGAVDVVAHLLAGVAEDGVGGAGRGALHQVGEEAVQLGAGVLGAGQAAAAEADRRHPEVAAVLLDQQVGGGLGDAEQRVGRGVDRHRGVDAAVVAVRLGQLQPQLELLQRQPVGRVAVDLVGRAEDEGRLGAVGAGRLEQVERAVGVDAEVGLRIARRPVVGGLRGGVDHQLDRLAVGGEDALDRVAVADVGVFAAEAGMGADESLGDVRGRGLGAEEAGPHVVLDPDHVVTLLDEVPDRLRADQP